MVQLKNIQAPKSYSIFSTSLTLNKTEELGDGKNLQSGRFGDRLVFSETTNEDALAVS